MACGSGDALPLFYVGPGERPIGYQVCLTSYTSVGTLLLSYYVHSYGSANYQVLTLGKDMVV